MTYRQLNTRRARIRRTLRNCAISFVLLASLGCIAAWMRIYSLTAFATAFCAIDLFVMLAMEVALHQTRFINPKD